MIKVQVTKRHGMNVYMYGGSDRFTATESIIENNQQAEENEVYEVDSKKGLVLIAYPDANTDTTFEFKYWIAEP